jgi:hypothetical protein
LALGIGAHERPPTPAIKPTWVSCRTAELDRYVEI